MGRRRAPGTRAERRPRGGRTLAAYREAGNAFLETLEGNFALVLMDERRARVLLSQSTAAARNAFASLRAGNTLAFSTSARAVARHPQVAAGLSRQAIYEYLYCHMVPSPDTVFDGVEKLLPAQCLVFERGETSRRHYWQLSYDTAASPDEPALRQRFLALTRQAVERQIDPQRTTGAFLSGGTDSSTVSGMLGRITERPADTFSIGFEAQGLRRARIRPHRRTAFRDAGARVLRHAGRRRRGNATHRGALRRALRQRVGGTDLLLCAHGARTRCRGRARRGWWRRILRRQRALRQTGAYSNITRACPGSRARLSNQR